MSPLPPPLWLRTVTKPDCFLARHHQNDLQVPEMDRIQPRDGPHNEPTPLDQKLFEHMGGDAPLRLGPPGFGGMASRSNDATTSSSHAMQFPGHRVGNQGTSHVSFVPYRPGRSSSSVPYDAQPKPAPSYPHGSEELFAPMSSHVDSRRVAMKRKNPVDGLGAGDYYVGSSSSSRFSNIVQPNSTAHTEPLFPQMPLSIGPSNWHDQPLVNQEGSQRNVRARHDRANISVEPRPGSTSTSSNNHLPLFHSAASAFRSTSAERNQALFSLQTRTLPSGATGITGRASTGRLHHPAMQSSSSSVAAPPVHGSSDTAMFANGGYAAPRAVHGDGVSIYAHPSSAASSSSRAIPHNAVIPSYPPATSTSMRINQPSPVGTAASSRQARHVSMAHANSGRNRMARSSFYGHPLMLEAQRLMLETQLAYYQSSRQAVADPHRDLRLNIDEMSYEELLALEETIGNVNTGLADEKISGCVKEVVCCSSDQAEDNEDEEDGRCLVCLEGYIDNDLLGVLKCGHDFHAGCIKKWLQVKNACPVCKQAAA
ncbi:hypothetical protein ACQ4PT_008563 [Festuca glaucescens]